MSDVTKSDRLLIASSLIILGALSIFDFGVFWQGCHHPDGNAYNYQSPDYENCAAYGLVTFFIDIWALIHKWREDIAALSTLAIAAFTVVLAWATHRQARLTRIVAEAAKVSADALPNIERAHLFIEVLATDPALEKLQAIRDLSDDTFVVVYRLSNYGKTPAIVELVLMDCTIVTELPDAFGNGEFVRWDEINLAPGESTDWRRLRYLVIPADDWQDIEIGAKELAFYGLLTYKDIFGASHKVRFCYLYRDGELTTIGTYANHNQRS